MELKASKKHSQKDTLARIKEALAGMGYSLIKDHTGPGGNLYEFESGDMTTRVYCRISATDSANVFIEFGLPAVARKLKEALEA